MIKELPNIIGVRGDANSGKDTFTKFFCELFFSYSIYKFVDVLCEVTSLIIGVPVYNMLTAEDKNKKISQFYINKIELIYRLKLSIEYVLPDIDNEKMNKLVKEMIFIISYPITNTLYKNFIIYYYNIRLNNDKELIKLYGKDEIRIFNGKTVRDMLQIIGTECFRELVDNDIWVNKFFDRNLCCHIIIDDIRFPNETKAVRSRGGIIVEIRRKNNKSLMNKNNLEHISENALNLEKADIIIYNNGSLEDFKKNIKSVFKLN